MRKEGKVATREHGDVTPTTQAKFWTTFPSDYSKHVKLQKNRNRLRLLITGISSRHIFLPYIFSKHTNVNFIEKYFHLITWNKKQLYTISYLTCIWNSNFIKHGTFWPHIMFNLMAESGRIEHRRLPRVWHAWYTCTRVSWNRCPVTHCKQTFSFNATFPV
jgi:hypothetical protein